MKKCPTRPPDKWFLTYVRSRPSYSGGPWKLHKRERDAMLAMSSAGEWQKGQALTFIWMPISGEWFLFAEGCLKVDFPIRYPITEEQRNLA